MTSTQMFNHLALAVIRDNAPSIGYARAVDAVVKAIHKPGVTPTPQEARWLKALKFRLEAELEVEEEPTDELDSSPGQESQGPEAAPVLPVRRANPAR